MSKYEPLTAWLLRFGGDRITLAFAEVEEILGSPLPASSYNHEAHWRGSTAGRPGGAIAAAGWGVERIDQMGRSITVVRHGRAVSRAPASPATPESKPVSAQLANTAARSAAFEQRARAYFSALWGVELRERKVPIGDGHKSFDLVSEDFRIIGDAKDYSDAANASGKRATVLEYVALMKALPAERRFLVFSNRVVPATFLRRFRSVASGVDFYLLADDRHEVL
jgi:hypothetical protein